MRPDINYSAIDIEGRPEAYPKGTIFSRCDVVNDKFPLDDKSIDAVTCMHVVEHLENLENLFFEINRILKKGGLIYFETPRPKTLIMDSPHKKLAGSFTLNFYDDLTHKKIITIGELAHFAKKYKIEIINSGFSRNWLFFIYYIFSFLFPDNRKKIISYIHFKGWSSFLICRK